MTHAKITFRIYPLILFFVGISLSGSGQCPSVYDFYGAESQAPYWYECSGNDFSFNLFSPDNWGDYSIDWGDGSAITSGSSWIANTAINHVYSAVVDTFNVVITETATGCVINGVVVMEEATSASIQIPVGGLTQACAPQDLEFINSSTNVSETTIFVWDFGDGSPNETYDYTNLGETVTHTYEQGTVDCETQVSLTAENYCNTIQGGESEATFDPIRIWDLDDAAITASALVLCYPDTTVEMINTSERNCLFQGNIAQRYEYWNFGDYWGLGYDSIVDWTPWPPATPHTLHYPGLGTYNATLLDSNFCGIDTAYITIQIVEPPIAAIDLSVDTVCAGDLVTLYQNATGFVETYEWNFGDGSGWVTTGDGNITYQYNTPGDYTICSAIGIPGSGACTDTTCVVLNVQPGPDTEIMMDNFEACNNLDVNFTEVSNNVIDFQWTFDVAPFTYNGPTPPTISYTDVGEYTVTLEVESPNGCLNSTTETVNVFPNPEANFETQNVCEGAATEFIDSSAVDPNDPILSWSWDFGDNETSSFQHPSHTYQNIGTYAVTLVVSTANCSDEVSFEVTVDPSPTADFTADNLSGCSSLDVAFSNLSLDADSYEWDFGDGQNNSNINPLHTYQHQGISDTTFTVYLTAFSLSGCPHTDSLDITVSPGAVANFEEINLPPGCAPYDATFINTSTGAESFFWDFGDGNTSTLENPEHIYYNETGFIENFEVEMIAYAPNGCNDTISSTVIVYPTPHFDFTVWPDSGCSPLMVTMPFVQGVNTFEWDFGDGNSSEEPTPTHIYENNTMDPLIYTVSLFGVSPFGCPDSAYSDIIVNPQPIAQFSANLLSGCSPLEVEFTNFSNQSDFYSWDYDDGFSSDESLAIHSHTFQNLTDSIVIYEVLLTAFSDDGCSDEFVVPIQVYPEIQAGFEEISDGCNVYNIELENSSLNGDFYQWDFGNGISNTDENPTTFYVNDTGDDQEFTVCLNVTSSLGCSGDYCQDFIVHPSPDSEFNLSNTIACDPAPILLYNNSTLADSYTWFYGNGTSSNNEDPVHEYLYSSNSSDPVDYEIMLVATTEFGCVDTSYQNFTLNPEVSAILSANSAGCSPLEVDFINLSQGATDGYEWDFGDGETSEIENPSHVFFNETAEDLIFEVMLVGNSVYGCSDTTYQEITVYHTPVSNVEVEETLGCYPLEVVFSNQSTGAVGYTWVYGTGQTGTTSEETHSYIYYNNFSNEPVEYDVTLIAYSDQGCSSSDETTVLVYPQLEAAFLSDQEDCSPFPVQFQNISTGAESYEWNFGDGNISSDVNPEHTFFNSGIDDLDYEVMLIAESFYGCFDTTYVDITVLSTPIANFNVTPSSQMFPDASIEIINASQAGDVTYNWDMNDGNELTGQDPGIYTYDTWGDYIIELIVTNGSCADTAWQAIEILPPPPVAFFEMDTIGCSPLTIQFNSESTAAASYHWEFGDGGQAFVSNPVYTYYNSGTYDVTLTVTGYGDNQSDSYTVTEAVYVGAQAQAAFTLNPTEVTIPDQPVTTINLSSNATSFEWHFGDGQFSWETNPVHYYTEVGIYDITLIAYNEAGCPDTIIIPAAVNAIASGTISYPNAFTPNLNVMSDGYYDPASFNNDVFRPIHEGVTEYKFQIYNKWGELLFETDDVKQGWNGYYKGAIAKEDVYVWKAWVRFSDGTRLVEAGDLTLLIK